jgi:hypothetical protein
MEVTTLPGMARNSHKKKYLRVSIAHGVGVVIMSQRELPCVFHVVPGNALDRVTVNALGVVSVPGRTSEPCCVFCLFGWLVF